MALFTKKRRYGDIKNGSKPTINKKYQNKSLPATGIFSFPMAVIRRLFWPLTTLVIIGILGGTVAIAIISKDLPDPDKLIDRQVAQSTKIYDRTGKTLLFETTKVQKRTLVKLSAIPKNLVNGLIATEDKIFYEHRGVRPLSIMRSLVYGVLGKGQVGGGASTLTQQLIKNTILTNEKTVTRKIKEIILSVRLEQKYSKDQILQIYFNEIPYGGTNFGVEAASDSYFGKPVSELNLQESATLAGLPKSPSKFLREPKALKDRRDFVLERMFEEKYISREEADKAQAEPITLASGRTNLKAPHFVMYILKQLEETYGEYKVNSGGLRVITSLDWDKQQIAEETVSSSAKMLVEAGGNNTALVALDPKNSQVLAMVGSRDYNNNSIDGKFNAAVDGQLQPGSSIKPIVYAAAFEQGYTPDTVLFDVKTNFAVSGDAYIPQNYDGKERGLVTMRQALQGSLNIPAVETMYLVGVKKTAEFAKRMGYTTLDDKNIGLSLVLGGGVVHPIEHVNAFAILANNGIRHNISSIIRVEDSQGETVYAWKDDGGQKILDSKITTTMSNVLSDDEARAFTFGARSVLTLPDRPVAAKTGTTDKYKDAWTVGYTPSLVAGVWAGNSDGHTPMKPGNGGAKVAGVIWNTFMKASLKNSPAEQFPTPPINDTDKPILRGAIGGIKLSIDRVTGKIATTSTPSEYIEEKTFVPGHSILHYVNKNDPRGPAPEHPEEDPQYKIWEAAIQDWVAREKTKNPDWNISFEEPPTEFDDEHSLELAPLISVLSPEASSTLSSRELNITVDASAKRGVAKVGYKLDDRFIGVSKESPFSLQYYAEWLQNGNHTLYITAEDDIGNKREERIRFSLLATEEPPRAYWSMTDFSVSTSNQTHPLTLNYYKLEQLQRIIIYQEKNGVRSEVSTITDFTKPFNNQIQVTWQIPRETGSWKLTGESETKDGQKRDIGVLNIQVE